MNKDHLRSKIHRLVARSEASPSADEGLGGEVGDLLELALQAKKANLFEEARRLLLKAEESLDQDALERPKVLQELAMCTYKDEGLPVHERFDGALAILNRAESLETTRDPETLGLAGAIYKNLWRVEGRRSHLERSYLFYSRGSKRGPEHDDGYTAINASYVLDLLADAENRSARGTGGKASRAATHQAKAQEIRREILGALVPRHQPETCDNWWILATLIEAFFGLGHVKPTHYDDACRWIRQSPLWSDGKLTGVSPEDLEVTLRQLVSLALAQGVDLHKDQRARSVLHLLGDIEAIESAIRGKIGLGLSGGGFRASFFHIGMLARLAELDALRNVEVISCVSGGSIVGAHYYLLLREALQSKEKLTREDYMRIVQDLLDQFLTGARSNIRTRVNASIAANLKMAFSANYSRTERVGELYESRLFRQAVGPEASLRMSQLKIHPLENGQRNTEFHPRRDNSRRTDKIPILVLNATTLNTGHNWQFTTAWMGEPAAAVDGRIDNNEHLQVVRYSEARRKSHGSAGQIRLGQAVAASACVPGLFEPLTLENFYQDRTVRLVDGGVYDNQGIAALLELGCTHLIISDASGHMETEKNPDGGTLGVPMRSSSILQARVRLTQFKDLVARERAGLLRGLVFLHLKKDLDIESVAPIYRTREGLAEDESNQRLLAGRTSYFVRKDFQALLAAIRTDLDGFHDAEAFSLMLSGYWMTDTGLLRDQGGAAFREGLNLEAPRKFWLFRLLEPVLLREPAHARLTKLLRASSQTALKTWHLSKPIQAVMIAVATVFLIVALAHFFTELHKARTSPVPLARLGQLASLPPTAKIFGALGLSSLILLIVKVVTPAGLFLRFLRRVGKAVLWLTVVWIPTVLSLLLFNQPYLRLGRLNRLHLGEHLDRVSSDEPTPDGSDWETYKLEHQRAYERYLKWLGVKKSA